MPRRRVPAETTDEVLVRSRRRCCICYGLNRDTQLKAGQIAHLDGDNSNGAPENLAFLCLAHHDEYDSRTSQRKNFTLGEVKRFRAELYEALDRLIGMQVHFGQLTLPPRDPMAGQYILVGSDDVRSAELTLTPLPDGPEGQARYHISGLATFGAHRRQGPNFGELDFSAELVRENTLVHTRPGIDGEDHVIWIQVVDHVLELTETNYFGSYGMNVTFGGMYRRVGDAQSAVPTFYREDEPPQTP